MLPGWAIARPGLHFAHPGNVERPTQIRGYFCIMNHNRKNNEISKFLVLKKQHHNTTFCLILTAS